MKHNNTKKTNQKPACGFLSAQLKRYNDTKEYIE